MSYKPGEREYRSILMPFSTQSDNKRFDTKFYTEGYATTFNSPYVMWEDEDGTRYYEQIDRNALDGADLSDVLFLTDHMGTPHARNKMAKDKKPTLLIEPNDKGLFIAADLALTEDSRKCHNTIEAGLMYQMSWAFRVLKDAYDRSLHTRTILKIKKVYDVSVVSRPANGDTEISARSYIDGVIDVEKREALARQQSLELAKKKYFILYGGNK